MTRTKDLLRKIISEVAELTLPIEEIADEDDLTKAGIDSIGFVSLIIEIEDKFSIEFPQEKFVMTLAGTINELAKIIDGCMGCG